ncbi:hypothetical protein FPSM_00738 [Flavobacterium psychrophilum]|nr:hypothetical protein FPSM_00738 [Flavobacterium psychrophilum]
MSSQFLLYITSFFRKMLFSTNQKELPLVAFLLQEKIHFLSKGFPLPSGAKNKI